MPLVGPVPGVERLMLATGHEGSGLCMVRILCISLSLLFFSFWFSFTCLSHVAFIFFFLRKSQVNCFIVSFWVGQALGTAEMLVTRLLGKETVFDVDPYLPASRLCHSQTNAQTLA